MKDRSRWRAAYRLNALPISIRVFTPPCLALAALLILVIIAGVGLGNDTRYIDDLGRPTFRFALEAKQLSGAPSGAAFLAVALLAMVVSVLVTVVLGRSITRPIRRLSKAMIDLAAGDLSVAVPELDRGDEVGSMAVATQLLKNRMIEAERIHSERDFIRARELDRLRQLAEATFEGIVIHREGRIIDVNTAFCTLLGQADPAALLGSHVLSLVAPGSIAQARNCLRERNYSAVELDMQHANGGGIPVEALARPIDYNGGEATLVAIRDLSEHKRAEAKIRQLAFHDSLTGLPNRALFGDRLTQALSLARRDDCPIALLYLDLDHFKEVNDTLGHAAGDMLLRVVAERLRACLRASDTLARLGGDEFAVIQPDGRQPEDAQVLARRLVEALEPVIELEGNTAWIGVSIGIAISNPADTDAVQKMMKDADVALYQAKAAGRGRYSFFSPDMNERVLERHAMEADLRTALAEERLFVAYQPQVALLNGDIIGAEALLRWQRNGQEMVPPDRFIPIAEDCGLIGVLGSFVLRTACCAAVTWPSDVRISVNVSPLQLTRPHFVESVHTTLQETGLPPNRLELEITERALLRGNGEVLTILSRLRDLGVRIVMDGFGTGFCSLATLLKFRFDKIKIDRSLVRTLSEDKAAAIIGVVVGVSEALQICSSASGVETQRQADMLLAQGCNEAQGILYGGPMAAEDVAALLNGRAGVARPLQQAAN